MSRQRAYTFTINNDTSTDLDMLLAANFQYLCFGFEVGEEGTPHIQGYIYFHDAKTKKAVSKKVMPRAYIEASKGTCEENDEYTSKEGDWYVFGERPTQGAAKWDKIESVMRDPKTNPHLFNQYYKTYRIIQNNTIKKHTPKLYLIPLTSKWDFAQKHQTVSFDYDTYDGEDVYIERPYTVQIDFIEQWANGYPPKIKRGYELINFNPEFIYITYEDQKEKNHIIKMLGDYIDQCL